MLGLINSGTWGVVEHVELVLRAHEDRRADGETMTFHDSTEFLHPLGRWWKRCHFLPTGCRLQFPLDALDYVRLCKHVGTDRIEQPPPGRVSKAIWRVLYRKSVTLYTQRYTLDGTGRR